MLLLSVGQLSLTGVWCVRFTNIDEFKAEYVKVVNESWRYEKSWFIACFLYISDSLCAISMQTLKDGS